jgi:hypothetical protein
LQTDRFLHLGVMEQIGAIVTVSRQTFTPRILLAIQLARSMEGQLYLSPEQQSVAGTGGTLSFLQLAQSN